MRLTVILLLTLLVAGSAGAEKIYLNPSDQIHNTSPDESYNEAAAMKIVAQMLQAKLSARGFEVQNSDGGTMRESCDAANAWPADIFISLHTNARGGEGWGTPHGTTTLYYQPREGEINPISKELSDRCLAKCIEKFTTYGRGHDHGSVADLPYLNFNLFVLRRTNMPGTLVEGLFHDNEADTACLKTDEGKDSYAQGVYEAVCDHFGWSYYPDAPILDPSGPVANDSRGLLAVVALSGGGGARCIRQIGINAAWGGEWLDLGGPVMGKLAMARNAQGRLQVFAQGNRGKIYHKVQASAGSDRWNGWYDLGGRGSGYPTVATNSDGRLILFAIGVDGHLRYRMQVRKESALAWEEWQDLGGIAGGKPAVCLDADGQLLVACSVPEKGLIVATQSGDEWTVRNDLDDVAVVDPVLLNDREGVVTLFCRGLNGHVLTRTGTTWQDLGGQFLSGPAVGVSTDGRFEVFGIDAQLAISHASQNPDGTWTDWQSLGGSFSGGLGVGRNLDGRIEVVARGQDGKVQYRVQREPAKSAIWDGWYPLGDTVTELPTPEVK